MTLKKLEHGHLSQNKCYVSMISPPSVPIEEWFQALRVPKAMDVQVLPIKWHSWSGEAARLGESLPAMHRVLGLILSTL